MKWILIAYFASGFGTMTTGGPVVIGAYYAQAICEETANTMMKMTNTPKWVECVRSDPR